MDSFKNFRIKPTQDIADGERYRALRAAYCAAVANDTTPCQFDALADETVLAGSAI